MNEINENSIVRFNDGNFELEVRISADEETVWLTQDQMAELFGVQVPAISKHLKTIFNKGELLEKCSSFHFGNYCF